VEQPRVRFVDRRELGLPGWRPILRHHFGVYEQGRYRGYRGGKITLGADASVATGPVGRQGSAATDTSFNAEIYSYARTRGLFGGIALDGSVIAIDNRPIRRFTAERRFRDGDFFGQAPTRPRRRSASRAVGAGHAHCRESLPRTASRSAGDSIAAQTPGTVPPNADGARTYPLEEQK